MGFRRRLRLLFVLACVGAAVVWFRVVQLQAFEGAQWREAAAAKRTLTRDLAAPRGRIRDAEGRVVAEDRPVPQLAFVGAEWTRRARLRCTACNAVHFYDPKNPRRTKPKRCRCKQEGATLEPLPEGDLTPLEAAIGLEPGTLATRAEERLKEVDRLVEVYRNRLETRGEPSFLQEDAVRQRQRDLLHRRFVILRTQEIGPEALRLLELDERGAYRGFRVRYVRRREYASPGPPGQMLGYVSAIADPKEFERLQRRFGKHVTLDTRVGRVGLERAYEDLLLGKKGQEVLERGESGAFTEVIRETAPEMGKELHLSLTTPACQAAHAAIQKHADRLDYFPGTQPSGGLVLLEADTGRVLAWAELPHLDVRRDLPRLFDPTAAAAQYDPSIGQWVPDEERGMVEGETLEEFRARLSKPAPLHLSRVSQIAVEPGSTMKVFVGLGLLEGLRHMEGHAVLPHGGVHGHFECGLHARVQPKCHRHPPCGFVEAIAYSCNRYFALGLRDIRTHWPTYRRTVPAFLLRFGFGQPSGLDVAGEGTGRFLRDYVDFEVHAPLRRAVDQVEAAGGPKTTLRIQPGVPKRVAGRGPERLEEVARRLLEEGGRTLHATEAVLRIEKVGENDLARSVTLDLMVAFRIPQEGARATSEEQGAFLKAARAALGKVGATLSDEPPAIPGARTIAFELEYHRPVGRKPGEGLVILKDEGRNVAIGQGPIAATPIQMARAVAVIANGGRLVTPHVVDTADGIPVRTSTVSLGLDPHDLGLVKEGMRGCVTMAGGTAVHAGFGRVPARVYGKTGTAQPGGWWRPEGMPGKDVWHHWFVGFAERRGMPTVAFACVLHARREEAAGRTAALAASEFLHWWFTKGPDAR